MLSWSEAEWPSSAFCWYPIDLFNMDMSLTSREELKEVRHIAL